MPLRNDIPCAQYNISLYSALDYRDGKTDSGVVDYLMSSIGERGCAAGFSTAVSPPLDSSTGLVWTR